MTEQQLLALLAPFVKAPDDGEIPMHDFYCRVYLRLSAALKAHTYPGGHNYVNPDSLKARK